MVSFRRALLAATILALPAGPWAGALGGAASAQPVTGLYIAGGGGWNQVQDADIALRRGGYQLQSSIENAGTARFDAGFAGLASLGWGFGNGIRAEVEGNYRENDVNAIGGFDLSPFIGIQGRQRSYGAMGNVFYDIDLARYGVTGSPVTPYVGLGAGYVWTEWQGVRAQSVPSFSRLSLTANDSDGQFAYQAIAGMAFPLGQFGLRGLSVTAEYRFLGTLTPKIQTELRRPDNSVADRGKIEPDNYNHAVLVGLRYALFQPPPPPAPVVAPAVQTPAPARTFLVFFDWDRADLTARAREIIAEAAQNARRAAATRIEVAGHADRSGTPAYNQRLSQRRADAVAAELVARGIARDEIAVSAYGESRPLVPTADGVREPQNRRVEIVLR
jgi:outer membrane protein OmpA-like peptidoglycan-associated protein